MGSTIIFQTFSSVIVYCAREVRGPTNQIPAKSAGIVPLAFFAPPQGASELELRPRMGMSSPLGTAVWMLCPQVDTVYTDNTKLRGDQREAR